MEGEKRTHIIQTDLEGGRGSSKKMVQQQKVYDT